jgi:hypothetical protein
MEFATSKMPAHGLKEGDNKKGGVSSLAGAAKASELILQRMSICVNS